MYEPLGFEQSQHLREAARWWEEQLPLLQEREAVAGGMQWKDAKGRQYLIRHWNDRVAKKKQSASLGVRGPDTEQQFAEFQSMRDSVDARSSSLDPRLERFSRQSRALRMPRLPAAESDVFRALGKSGLDREFMVFSQEALHAYGATFDVRFELPTRHESEVTLYLAAPDLDVAQDGLLDVMMASVRGMAFESDRFVLDRAAGRLTIVPYSTLQLFSMLRRRRGFGAEQEDVLWDALQQEPLWAAVIGDDGLPVPMSAVPPKAFLFLTLATGVLASDAALDVAEAIAPEVEFSDQDIEAFPELERVTDAGGPRA